MEKLPNEVKDKIHAEDTENSDKVIIYSTTILSTSNTLKNLAANKSFHSSYIQREYNDKKGIIIKIFSEYVEPILKDINHPALLQERKINPDAAEYKRNIDANLYKTSEEKKFSRHDSESYCRTSIKDTINWFPFITIMEHTENIIKTNKRLTLLLLKVFAMFELRLISDKEKLHVIAIRCINCKK